MDDVTICDVRARDIRIWQINSQNFRIRKIWKTFLAKCDLYHSKKLQSLKMFKTTKDMFYKQFDFFCKLTGPIMGLREPCPLVILNLSARFLENYLS